MVETTTNKKRGKVSGEEEKVVSDKGDKNKKKVDPKKSKKENKKGEGVKKLRKVPKHIKYLLLSEKAVDNINFRNTLVFIVDNKVNKQVIKKEVEESYEVKVKKIRTLIDRKGRKKAYVVLQPEYSAEEVATQLGMM